MVVDVMVPMTETPMECNITAMSVAMFAVPAKGHFLPLCDLAAELRRRGHAVVFYVFDVFEEDFRHFIDMTGSVCRTLPTPFKDKSEAALPPKDPKMAKEFLKATQQSYEHLLSEWRQATARPSVAVGDMFSHMFFEAAHELGIPMVMNCPGPRSLVNELCCLADPQTAISFAGFTLLWSAWTTMGFMTYFVTPLKEFRDGMKLAASSGHVLINSFDGLEPHGIMPTNWTLTGPLVSSELERLSCMARDHAELNAWMDSAAERGCPVIYVSTGTITKLTEWETQTLFAGLEQSPCKVVWSLQEESHGFLPRDYDKGRFWISAWLPQSALLAHRATKLCMSHCGWGGSMEAINAGVPIFAIPYGADQPTNAKLLVEAGAALMLPTKPSTSAMLHVYKPGAFTAETISAGIERMLGEPKFQKAMSRLKELSAFAGGRRRACDQIEMFERYNRLSQEGPASWKNNVVLRNQQGHWSNYIIRPALCLVAVIGMLYFLWGSIHSTRIQGHFCQ